MDYIIIKDMYCSTKRNFFIRTVYSVKIGTNIELNRAAPIYSVIRFYEYHMRSSEGSLKKTSLAITQVKLPHSYKLIGIT